MKYLAKSFYIYCSMGDLETGEWEKCLERKINVLLFWLSHPAWFWLLIGYTSGVEEVAHTPELYKLFSVSPIQLQTLKQLNAAC